MAKKFLLALLLVVSVLLPGCQEEDSSPAWSPGPRFETCGAGGARALRIDSRTKLPTGPDALAAKGDYMLVNDQAAFVISNVDKVKTYFYYGGILIDAVALNDCRQAGPEQFDELGLAIGSLDTGNPLNSGLRAFRGESVEILNDGRDGGDAVVRVHGTDDVFWIVELTIIRLVFTSGGVKPFTPPFGVSLDVDYILPPDSSVMRIEYHIANNDPTPKGLIAGTEAFFGDATTLKYYYNGLDNFLGYTLFTEVPYMVASAGTGAWAFAMKDAEMSMANIAGITAMLDANQMGSPLNLAPAGTDGDTATVTYFFAVGGGDYNSALVPLAAVNPEPLPGMDITLHPISGTAYDSVTGEPLAGVEVELQNQNAMSQWRFIDGFITGPDGTFAGEIPDLGRQYRLVANAPGRPGLVPPTFLVSALSTFDLPMDAGGTLAYDIHDEAGRQLPCKITLWESGNLIERIHTTDGYGSKLVPAGTYDVSVTRGFEYTIYEGTVTITSGEVTILQTSLTRAVDTRGFLSMDGHIHAGPSGDNSISIPDRIATVAAEGLEVAISTDHEIIVPWQPAIEKQGLTDWVATVLGQEVTATVPEHTGMYPVPPRPDLLRGGPVPWYDLDLPAIFAAERERGAGIVQLNHPRNGCNYMCLIKYNRITGLPTLTDPTAIGLPAGSALWTFNFDALEFQNGNQDPFMNPGDPNGTGTFEDWMSFLNLGHRITVVANSDAHNFEIPGNPRNYFASSTDRPQQFKEAELVAAIKQGRVLASTGAFARVQINGSAGMGDLVADGDGSVDLYVHIEAIPEIDVTRFKVFVNCQQVASVNTTAPNDVVKYDGHLAITVPTDEDAHVEVLGFGANYLPRGFAQFWPGRVPRFTANAIYIDANGNGVYDAPGGRTCSYTLP